MIAHVINTHTDTGYL